MVEPFKLSVATFDLIAIKTEMMMMMMWKVWMQCSCFYNMIHQNLPMYRPFLIMLLKLALYAPRNSALRQKKCSNYARFSK